MAKKFVCEEMYDGDGLCYIVAVSACRWKDYLPTFIEKTLGITDMTECYTLRRGTITSGWCAYQCRADWLDEEGTPGSGYYWVEQENKPQSGRGWFPVWIVKPEKVYVG